jgi:hypothetical protein
MPSRALMGWAGKYMHGHRKQVLQLSSIPQYVKTCDFVIVRYVGILLASFRRPHRYYYQ